MFPFKQTERERGRQKKIHYTHTFKQEGDYHAHCAYARAYHALNVALIRLSWVHLFCVCRSFNRSSFLPVCVVVFLFLFCVCLFTLSFFILLLFLKWSALSPFLLFYLLGLGRFFFVRSFFFFFFFIFRFLFWFFSLRQLTHTTALKSILTIIVTLNSQFFI